MSDIVIRTENLSKLYRVGEYQGGYNTLRETIVNAFSTPFRYLSRNAQSPTLNPQSDTIWALKDISFEVKRGEVVGIIGRNGAGKTTLLKILSRITEPTEGWAELQGRVGSLLEVGTGFHPELTGRENIYLNGAILGMKKVEMNRKFDEIVAFAEIEKFIDTPVKRYSSGMYVRLAFAVASHLQPEILLVDEVLAVGDIEFQKKCIGKMEKVAQEGRTVVVVSHSMRTVKVLCSRAVLLEHGAIKAMGPVDAVVAEYLGTNQVEAVEKLVRDEDHDPGGGNSIRVKKIRLLNGPLDSFSVYWKQPICVELEMEVFKQVEQVSLGAGIRMFDGSFVFVVYNDDNGRSQWNLEPGNYTVQFQIENNLRPGVYKLHVGAHHRHSKLKNVFGIDAVNLQVLDFTGHGSAQPSTNPGLVTGVESVFSYRKT